MTELNDSPSWFSTGDRYSGRTGSVPVPTIMTPTEQAETLKQMRPLAEAQRHRAEMLSRENRSLRESVKRLERMLAKWTAREELNEEAGELVQVISWEHDEVGCPVEKCQVCDLARRLRD